MNTVDGATTTPTDIWSFLNQTASTFDAETVTYHSNITVLQSVNGTVTI